MSTKADTATQKKDHLLNFGFVLVNKCVNFDQSRLKFLYLKVFSELIRGQFYIERLEKNKAKKKE